VRRDQPEVDQMGSDEGGDIEDNAETSRVARVSLKFAARMSRQELIASNTSTISAKNI